MKGKAGAQRMLSLQPSQLKTFVQNYSKIQAARTLPQLARSDGVNTPSLTWNHVATAGDAAGSASLSAPRPVPNTQQVLPTWLPRGQTSEPRLLHRSPRSRHQAREARQRCGLCMPETSHPRVQKGRLHLCCEEARGTATAVLAAPGPTGTYGRLTLVRPGEFLVEK